MRRGGPGPPILVDASDSRLRRIPDRPYVTWPTGPYLQRPAALTPAVDGTRRASGSSFGPWTARTPRQRRSRRSGRSGSAATGPPATRRSSASSAARRATRRCWSARAAVRSRSCTAPSRSSASPGDEPATRLPRRGPGLPSCRGHAGSGVRAGSPVGGRHPDVTDERAVVAVGAAERIDRGADARRPGRVEPEVPPAVLRGIAPPDLGQVPVAPEEAGQDVRDAVDALSEDRPGVGPEEPGAVVVDPGHRRRATRVARAPFVVAGRVA